MPNSSQSSSCSMTPGIWRMSILEVLVVADGCCQSIARSDGSASR
jgi:hypothetical protein